MPLMVESRPSCARLGRASAPVPTPPPPHGRSHTDSPVPPESLRLDSDQVGQAEWCVGPLAVAHVGVVVVVDVDIGDLLEVALTGGAGGGANDVHRAGGAGYSVSGVLVAGGDVDLAAVGGGGGGERGGVSETQYREMDGTGESAVY